MKTPFLDEEIDTLRSYKIADCLSDIGKNKLEEFQEIKRIIMMNSEPEMITDLRLMLRDYFLKHGTNTVELTAENIREHFGIGTFQNWLNIKAIRQFLNVNRYTDTNGKECVVSYSFYTNDPGDKTKFIEVKYKGRPFVFHRGNFVP